MTNKKYQKFLNYIDNSPQYMNTTELAVNMGGSINWVSTLIAITGALFGIMGVLFGIYIWFYDRRNMKKTTLYFPLFMTCYRIIDIIENYETLGEEHSRNLFASSAKTLDEIIYIHGSVIHLKRTDDLRKFLKMKKAIDENLEFIEKRNWLALQDRFKSDEFKDIKIYAEDLLKRCKAEVKEFKEL